MQIQGSHVTIQDLTLRHSDGAGLALVGVSNTVFRLNCYSNMENGILVTGAGHHFVSGCKAFWNAMANEFFTNTRGTWAGGINIMSGGYSIAQSNMVWNNWGEGMTTGHSTNNSIVDNTVWDNQTQIYVEDTQNSLVARNLIYGSETNIFSNLSTHSQVGIMLGDEQFNPPSSNNIILTFWR